jgi:hypothetical protein
MAGLAAQVVSDIELLLSSGASESSVGIDNQLKIFEASEHGLFATWETADALICVPINPGWPLLNTNQAPEMI